MSSTNFLTKLISRTIKEKRLSLGLTQYELAKKMEVPQSTVARLESGEIAPSASTLEKVFKILNIKITFVDEQIDKVFQVCNYIFEKGKQKLNEEYDITNLKLNKLIYYVYRESLRRKVDIFQNKFRAWEHGPVHLDVYHKFKEHGKRIIEIDEYYYGDLSRGEIDLIDRVLEDRLTFSGHQLRQQSHLEHAWLNARMKGDNEPIEDRDI